MPRIGDVLADRYRVEALLGAGGMAAVYRAIDLRLAREVAVKVLAPNLAADPSFAARFDREARALAAVAHPNVVAVFDVEPGDPAGGDEPFYVMELCNGGTLGDRLEAEGPIPPAELVPIVGAVADGLAALHSRGLVHRDIKPHNILFQDHRAKLGDFGLARSEAGADSSPLTVPGTTVRTLPFLAPELLVGDAPTQASDVYALGVTAFQALTGRYPKPSDSMREIVEHREEPPATVSSVVPGLGTAYDAPIGRALAEDPAARPSAVAFANTLQAALDSLPPSAFLPGGVGVAGTAVADAQGAGVAGAAGPAAAPGAEAAVVAGAAAGASAWRPPEPGTQTVISASPTIASGRASLNPDAQRLERPDSGQGSRRRRPTSQVNAGLFGSGLVPLGILLAVFGLAAVVAVTGLLGGGLGGFPGGSGPAGSASPGESPSESPLESPSPTAPGESPSPSPTSAPTTDPAAPGLAAVQDVISAVQAAQGGRGGLNGRDASELIGLATTVRDALLSHDYDRARSTANTLADRADKLGKDLDEPRRTALQNSIAALIAAIPA
jgi:hypothetical protein